VAVPDSPSPDLYAAVVYNPRTVDVGRLRTSVNAAALAAGWSDTLWFATTREDAGQHVTRLALRQGVAVVIAVGGDGTVRAVAEVLRSSEVPLAIVPTGTGNLLARNLGLVRGSLDKSAAIAFSGMNRSIDLGVASITTAHGETTDHAFSVMAGVGLDAEMIANTRPHLKRQMGWLAYVDAGVRVIAKAEPFRIRYSVTGRPERTTRVSTLLVVNCGVLPGNMLFLPDAVVDDGILDIAVLQPKGVLGWLGIWRRVSWDNVVLRRSAAGRRIIRLTEPSNERTMTTFQAGDIRISLEHPQEFELDGDQLGRVKSVFLHADPGCLIVRVPEEPVRAVARR
jgi:diacylglycerol kinase (ATP)